MVVTGAAGWLGQNLVRALAADATRQRIRCLVQQPIEAPLLELVSPRVEVVVGDVRDPAALDELFTGTAGASVVHAAAVIHPARAVRELFDVNVGGTQLVLDRARRASSGRLVHISSNSPFGVNRGPAERFDESSPPDPYLGYGASKAEAEELVRTAHGRGDVEAVILRPPWFYGPFQPVRQSRWLRTVRRGRFPLVGDGAQRRSMVYAGNLVDAIARAEVVEEAAGQAYWVADAEPYELRAILTTVREAFEAEGLPTSGGTPRLPAVLAVVAEQADRVLQGAGRYVQAAHVLGELRHTIACDIGKARAELGYQPAVSLLEGMRRSIKWCVARGVAL